MCIIIADDDPDFRTLAIRQIRREFPEDEITEVGDPAGLEAALRATPPPGLLVSDLNLNWTDGFAVLQAVRAVSPDCPAIMFTGTGNEEIAVKAIKAGFDDYVVKSPKQLRRLAVAARAAVTRVETRRGLEQNRDVLTAELYHRLHNNLQLVISLITFTARALADEDARRKLDDLSRRVQSLSLLQEKLYRGGDFQRVDFAAYLRQMTDDLTALNQRPVAVVLRLDVASLPVTTAVPLGLIANELITNALKHAFSAYPAAENPPDGGRDGRLVVKTAMLQDGGVVLEVSDNGTGVGGERIGAETPAGLGMRLVRRLAQQLGARFEMDPAETGGTRCRVTVPGRVDAGSMC